jgi:hypothetical protein
VSPEAGPQNRRRVDLDLYEHLIRQGVAEADERGTAIDHVTARRMALWLLPRCQDDPDFMRHLIRFAQTGAVNRALNPKLRQRAWSASHPSRPYASRLLQYVVARGTDRGPIGPNFAAVCEQMDQADAKLIDLRDRLRDASRGPQPAPETGYQQVITLAHHDPESQTVTLILDTATATATIHAITSSATNREAHTREIQRESQNLPPGSFGKQNRETIAFREARTAARLRAVERAYQAAINHEGTPALDLSQLRPALSKTFDREPEQQ